MRKLVLYIGLVACATSQAQNTFLNERLNNNSNDVIGTARYVGMGGAMGALGADISTISWNPAGIGLYRKNEVSLTFGGLWGKSSIKDENAGTGTFDQMGFVYNIRTGDSNVPYVNLSFNYQKKANYNYNFYAGNANLRGLSQMDQLAELATYGFDTNNNLSGLVLDLGSYYFTPVYENGEPATEDEKPLYYKNIYDGKDNMYTHHSEGSLQGYDINFSTNIRDRAYVGLTFGVDNVSYRSWSTYTENDYVDFHEGTSVVDAYDVYNDAKITGYGIGVKLGTIFRPFESSSFRIGLVAETPTWYRMKNSTLYQITKSDVYESYMEYTMRTPWKVRVGIGSTVGSVFAWDVDYEYANYGKSKMGYPKWDEYDAFYNSYSNNTDVVMNEHTKQTLRGVHTLRAGMEFRPAKAWAIRLGYNYITSAYEENVSYDQFKLAEGKRYSYAMDYATGTEYMRVGPTNILTVGLGYKYKAFFVDLAYKIRNQNADFYAFDTGFTNEDTDFSHDNPNMQGLKLDPVDVNLTRQTITCTLGFKF